MQNSKNVRDKTFRKIGDHKQATILSRNTDGSYQYETLRTKQVGTATPANPSEDFAPGARVVVGPLAASRETPGAGTVILTRNPREQRGVALIPSAAATQLSRAVMTSIVPNPVRLGIGDVNPQQLVIHGLNLTGAPTYGHANIVDDSAPVITSTLITCQLVAEAGCPVGSFSLTIHGTEARDVIETYEMPPWFLYLSGYENNTTNYVPTVVKIDPGALSVATVFQGVASGTTRRASGLCYGNGIVRALVAESGTNDVYLLVCNLNTGTASQVGPLTPNCGLSGTSNHEIVWDGTRSVFCSTESPNYFLYGVTDAGVLTTIATFTSPGQRLLWDGTYYWAGWASNGVYRITTAGVITDSFSGCGGQMDFDDTYVYASGNSDENIRRIVRSTAAYDGANIAYTGTPGVYFRHVIAHGGFLYATTYGGAVTIKKINAATMTVVGSISMTGYALGNLTIGSNGVKLYCPNDGDDRLHIIDLATFTKDSTTDLNILANRFKSEEGSLTA